MFLVSFGWFWFWRPYGFYGGDSEYLDRQVAGGIWFRKREMLAVAAMQLSRQIFTLQFGWPVAWSISLVSCLAGSFSVLLCWLLFRNEPRGWLQMALVLATGHVLLYHGSIESYALPTAVLMLWIYAIHRVDRGDWPTAAIPFAFALMVWCHLMALFLLPSLLASAWFYRERVLGKDLASWMLAGLAAFMVYITIHPLRVGYGHGIEFGDLFFHQSAPEVDEVGTFFTLEHLRIKSYFLWLGTHLSLPFATAVFWRGRWKPVQMQIGMMLVGALGFVAFFHPDCGYLDWDLFLLPSLPSAILGAGCVASSRGRYWISAIWVAAFLSIWLPRIPEWVRLSERGLARVVITNHPMDREVLFDGRYEVKNGEFYTQGGPHRLEVRKRGYMTYFKDFEVAPGDDIEIEVPLMDFEAPFAEQIRKLEAEADPTPK